MRSLKLMARMLALLAIGLVVLLLSCQSRLMYFPRAYGKASLWDLKEREGRQIEYSTSQGKQVAFYLPPRGDPEADPAFLWIVSGGNGALALDYSEEPMHWDARFGYLFVDYPGYGMCAGSPNPKRIEESTVAAAEAVRQELGWSTEQFRDRTGVFGHSIGCAAVLMAADNLKLKAAVLCAPFTTMTEMGRQILGWPLCYLNMHRFDNVSRLKALDARGTAVRIFHGAEDEVIPVTMSRRMHEMYPGTVQFTEVPEARHNDVVMRARADIGKAMRELAALP